MKILTRKDQDEILKEVMNIIEKTCGQNIDTKVLEELAESTFKITDITSGMKGLAMVLETLQEQIKLHAEILMKEIKESRPS